MNLINFLNLIGYNKNGEWHRSNIIINLIFWLRYILSSNNYKGGQPTYRIVLDNNTLVLFVGFTKLERKRPIN